MVTLRRVLIFTMPVGRILSSSTVHVLRDEGLAVLALQPNASLRIAIRAAHYLSGNKRTYALRYTELDIRPGVFRERLDVEIVPVEARSSGPPAGESTQ